MTFGVQHGMKWFLGRTILSCCVLLTLRVAQAQQISPAARKHFELARQAQDAGAFDKAIEEYTATTHLAPTFAGAYANLGLIYYVKGDFEDSATALARCIRLQPDIVGANLYLGIDKLKLNHPADALPYLQRAAQLDPANKDAQKWLGTAYWQNGQPSTALEQLRQTNNKFPGDPDILFVLGEAYRKTADQEIEALVKNASGTAYVHQVFGDIYFDQHALAKADAHYHRALAMDANLSNIHFDLGEVAFELEHFDAAEQEYRQQLRLDPANAPAMARLAELYLLRGDIPVSLHLFSQALQSSPPETAGTLHLPPSFATTGTTLSDASLQKLRALLPRLEQSSASPSRSLAIALVAANLQDADRFQAAWGEFEALEPNPRAPSNALQAAARSFAEQHFQQSEDEAHEWLTTHPHDLHAEYLIARCHRMLSLQVLDQLLTSFPDSYRSHQLLAQTEEERDEDDKAIAEYKKVEGLEPTLPGIHFALGHLLLKTGDLEQASSQLKGELQLDPDNAEANAEMGMSLLSQNNADDAIPYFTKSITAEPDLWIAHQQLGKAYLLQKNYPAAQKELTLALHEDPEGIAHYELGLLYKAEGQTQEAAREFDLSRKLKSDRLAEVKIEKPAND
jgi:tetratricopeptide (TPR) repeat protein